MTLAPEAILFDFGGTLDTDGIHWCEKYWDLYNALGVAVARPAFDAAYLEAERQLAHVAPLTGVGLDVLLERQVALQFAHLVRTVDGFEGDDQQQRAIAARALHDVRDTVARVTPMLQEVSRGRRLAVVSNFYGNLDQVLADLGLDATIDVSVDSVCAGVAKPDPEIFRVTVWRLGVPAERCLVVGDAYDRDIVPAKSVGCRTAWLRGRSWRTFDDVSSADAVIGSILELPRLLEPGAS